MKKMKKVKKEYISHILILLSMALFSSCNGIIGGNSTPPPLLKKKKKAVFIFCDVTGSLIKAESEQVAKLAADILDRLPSDSKYRLIPVHMKTESSEEILPMNSLEKLETEISDSLKEARRIKISEDIAKLYEKVNEPAQKPERTCILSGLGRAREFYYNLKDNPEKDEYEYELVFISDMLEHCTTTPAGQGVLVSIKDQKASDALQIIKSAALPDLSPMRITIITPGKNEAITKGTAKMSVQTLNAFWSEVFNKCKNKIGVDDWFTAETPNRIFIPQTE